MSDCCTASSCGTREASSECGTTSGCCSEGQCPACEGACGGDPVECATIMWTAAFFHALKQAHVDTLKAKILKAWGPIMDKCADAVVEAMGTKWESMMAEAKAKGDLREKLGQIMKGKK